MIQLHLFISGSVQGVGFRQFVKYLARKRGVTGWVRNLPAGRQGLPDGRVEAVLQGTKKTLEEMLRFVRKGSSTGKVTSVEVLWEAVETTYPEFEILKMD